MEYKNTFLRVGNKIINKKNIIDVDIRQFEDENEVVGEIFINYFKGKDILRVPIKINVSLVPGECDDIEGTPCNSSKEITNDLCESCLSHKNFVIAARKEFNRLMDHKVKELEEFLGTSIVTGEDVSFSLTASGPVRE